MTCGIPQGSVVGPCLVSLYTNDMPEAVTSGNHYLHADDTTVYCIGSNVDEACNLLKNALDELNKWHMINSLTPHSPKCEVMLFHRGSFTGPHPLITIGNVNVAWVCHTRLQGITIDRKLTWTNHFKELTLDLNFKVILPLVTYGIAIWRNCNKLDYINSLQALHCRAGRLIFNLPRDTPSEQVLELTQ